MDIIGFVLVIKTSVIGVQICVTPVKPASHTLVGVWTDEWMEIEMQSTVQT